VAATDRPARRRARRRLRKLRDLPWLATGIGALAARDAAGQTSVDSKFLFYKESGGRTQVFNPVLLLQQDLGENAGELSLLLGYDAISGASPTGAYPTSDVTTSASGHTIASGSFPQAGYTDARKSGALSYGRKFGAHLPSIDVSYAKENDYTARAIGLSDSWTMLHGLGTLHFGVAFSRDIVSPVKNPETNPDGLDLNLHKNENGFSLGWTQVLGERDLLDVSASLMNLSGYLTDPYKVVPIGADKSQTLPEQRPDTRSRRALVVKYGHHYLWDGALRMIYRYYNDSWSIQAHTLEVTYDQRVDSDWIVSPQVRLYTQTGASFYASSFAVPQTNMSADYRLAPLGSILAGLTVARVIDHHLTLSLGFTYQSQNGRDRVVPTGTLSPPEEGLIVRPVSAADMSILSIVGGLSWRP
jgi:hypothetical protein